MPITADKQPPVRKRGSPLISFVLIILFIALRLGPQILGPVFRSLSGALNGRNGGSLPRLALPANNSLLLLVGGVVFFLVAVNIVRVVARNRGNQDRTLPTPSQAAPVNRPLAGTPSQPSQARSQRGFSAQPTYRVDTPAPVPSPPRFERAFDGKVLFASIIFGALLFGGLFMLRALRIL